MSATHPQSDRKDSAGTGVLDSRIHTWVFCPHIGFEEALDASLIIPEEHARKKDVRKQSRTMFRVFCRFILERQLSIRELDWIVIARFLESRGVCRLTWNETSHAPVVIPIPFMAVRYDSYMTVIHLAMDYLVKAGFRPDNAADDQRLKLPRKMRRQVVGEVDASARRRTI